MKTYREITAKYKAKNTNETLDPDKCTSDELKIAKQYKCENLTTSRQI
jgi:hypothetical protein